MRTLGDIGEDALIERLIALVPVEDAAGAGPGDDCAVVPGQGGRLGLLKTDALVAGVHFEMTADPRAVGWKAVARVVSDFAAMGGVAERFLVTLALPRTMELEWVEDFYRGMGDCMGRFGAVLAGGETCRVPDGSAAVVSIAATGSVESEGVVLRSGGKPGDELWVTGVLGGSLAGRHLSFQPRVEEARWLVERVRPTAMMDLSDGLAKDLPRLAKASRCGFTIDREAIPRAEGRTVEQAMGDGEDFELLFSCTPGENFPEEWAERFPDVAVTRIGRLVEPGAGEELSGGWDHFG